MTNIHVRFDNFRCGLQGKLLFVVILIIGYSPLNLILLPYVNIVLYSPHKESPRHTSASASSLRREASQYYYSTRDGTYPRLIALQGEKQQILRKKTEDWQTINVTERYTESVLNEFYNDTAEQYTDTCIPMTSWQTQAFPTCNNVHEIDMGKGLINDDTSETEASGFVKFQLIGKGGSRLVFRAKWRSPRYNISDINENEPSNMDRFALKVLRIDRPFEPYLYEYNRVDATASERLTSAPDIVDIYGYCGMSVLNEPSSGWDMRHLLLLKGSVWEPKEILALILQASKALAHVHSFDYTSGRNATLVHNDITYNNYVLSMYGKLKLGDFNRAVPLRWNKTTNESCGFRLRKLGGAGGLSGGSPPEATYSRGRLTEKVDIYGLGTLIFHFLASYPIFQHELKYQDFYYTQSEKEEKILKLITNSDNVPQLPEAVEYSTDPITIGLKSVMRQALQHNESDRPTAQSIVEKLEGLYSSAEQQKEVLDKLYYKIPEVLMQQYTYSGKKRRREVKRVGEKDATKIIRQELRAAYDHIKNLEELVIDQNSIHLSTSKNGYRRG